MEQVRHNLSQQTSHPEASIPVSPDAASQQRRTQAEPHYTIEEIGKVALLATQYQLSDQHAAMLVERRQAVQDALAGMQPEHPRSMSATEACNAVMEACNAVMPIGVKEEHVRRALETLRPTYAGIRNLESRLGISATKEGHEKAFNDAARASIPITAGEHDRYISRLQEMLGYDCTFSVRRKTAKYDMKDKAWMAALLVPTMAGNLLAALLYGSAWNWKAKYQITDKVVVRSKETGKRMATITMMDKYTNHTRSKEGRTYDPVPLMPSDPEWMRYAATRQCAVTFHDGRFMLAHAEKFTEAAKEIRSIVPHFPELDLRKDFNEYALVNGKA